MGGWLRGVRSIGMIVVCLGLPAACGGGGGGPAGGPVGGGTTGGVGDLQILGHEPEDRALQVALDAEITILFDGAIDEGALNETELHLEDEKGNTIPGTYSLSEGGRRVHFRPSLPFEKAKDYVFFLAPTVCDRGYRTLDRDYRFTFRSFDDIPPRILGANVDPGAVGVSRTSSFTVDFDEAMDPASMNAKTVTLKDLWGNLYGCDLLLEGTRLTIVPWQDLPGNRKFVLSLRGGTGGVKDRPGNPLVSTWSVGFTTEVDSKAPVFVRSDPETGSIEISPRVRISLTFDESMDPSTYDPSAASLLDASMNPVPLNMTATRNLRTLHFLPIQPLNQGETYLLHLEAGFTGLKDVSGNPIAIPQDLSFTVGSDATGPTLLSASPAGGSDRISPNAAFDLVFDEALETSTVDMATIRLEAGGTVLPASVSLDASRTRLRVLPASNLPTSTACRLTLVSGYDGIQDVAGNPLAGDILLDYTTSSSTTLPSYLFSPGDGATGVPPAGRITILANEPLDPATATSSTLNVVAGTNTKVTGSLRLERGNRALIFTPDSGLPSGSIITVSLRGGPSGLRLKSGNWSSSTDTVSFRTGYQGDQTRPVLSVTANEIDVSRNRGLVLPPSGFTLDFSAHDPIDAALDWTTLALDLEGPGSVPGSDELFALCAFGTEKASLELPAAMRLPTGTYNLRATVKDLSGNTSLVATLSFEVAESTVELRPFERTQIVWVRFDTDREGKGKGDGTPDFDQDLLDYGLLSKGDPIKRNAFMRKVVEDGIIAVANRIFLRADEGGRKSGSVSIRLVTRKPCRAPHMQIAVGGKDPDGPPSRGYGAESTGILGRALFDYRNATPNENNAGTTPGLGVFPGELFLYQARQYLDLYPYYITTFGRRFRGISPHMGGVPAGSHALDAKVLAEGFEYAKATPQEKARYDAVMDAADDLASAIGVILAHEIGHSLGLVATGAPSAGLHGDSSLHNSYAGIGDVMSSVIGYESLVTQAFRFRALNLAYLRERILLK